MALLPMTTNFHEVESITLTEIGSIESKQHATFSHRTLRITFAGGLSHEVTLFADKNDKLMLLNERAEFMKRLDDLIAEIKSGEAE